MATAQAKSEETGIGTVGRRAQTLAHAISKGAYDLPGVSPTELHDDLTDIESWETLYAPYDRRHPRNRRREPPREPTRRIERMKGVPADGAVTGPYYPERESWRLSEFPTTAAKEASLSDQVLARYENATVFINGMNTSLADHRNQAQALANARQDFVVGVYNASSNPTLGKASPSYAHPADLPKAVADAQGYVRHNPATRTLTQIIARYGNAAKPDGGLRLYGPSQGSMIAVAALREAKLSSGTDLRKIDVKLVGTMVRTGPRGPRYDLSVNVSDWIALGARLGLSVVVDPIAAATGLAKGGSPLTDQSLIPFTAIKMRSGGHGLIKGYIPDETDSPALPRPMAGPIGTLLKAFLLHGGWIPIAVAQQLAPTVKAILKWVRSTGGQAWHWTNARVRELLNRAITAVHNAATRATQVAGRAWRTARAVARRAWERARTAASRAVQWARSAARRALDRARSIARRVRERAMALARAARDWGRERISRAADQARRAATAAWSWARRTASRLWEWGNRRGRGALDWVAGKVRGAWQRARSMASEASRRARGIRSSVRRWVRERARRIWDWATERASSVYERMRDQAGRAWDRAKDIGRSVWDRARRVGVQAWRGARLITEGARSLARRVAGAWWERLRSVGRHVWDWGRVASEPVWRILGRAVGGATAWGRSILDRMRVIGRTVGEPIWSFARRAAGRARDFVTRAGSSAWGWLRAAAGRAWDFARSLAGRAARGFDRLTRPARLAWQWGRRRLGSAYRWASSRARAALQRGASLARRVVSLGRAVAGRVGRGVRWAFSWLRRLVGRRVAQGRGLARRALSWGARLGRSLARRTRRAWRRFRARMRRPLRSLGRGVRRLGAFVRRTLWRAMRRVTRGLGILSSRGGAVLGRLLRSATRGAGLLGRTAGSLLGRILRRALRAPGTVGSWAGSMLGRLLGRARRVAQRLDRATGGLLTGMLGRLAHGAGTAGRILGGLLRTIGGALISGGGTVGRFLGGLVGRVLGRAVGGARAAGRWVGSAVGRLLGAGLRGARRTGSWAAGVFGRVLGAGMRGGRIVGRVVGQLAGTLMGRATQGAQLLGGMAGDLLGRLFGHAARGAGIVGRVLGRTIGRLAGGARRGIGIVGRVLRRLGPIGPLGPVGLVGRLVGRGVARLGSLVRGRMGDVARTFRRILVAPRPTVRPIGRAIGGVAARAGLMIWGTAQRLGGFARRVLAPVGRLARAVGGTGARVVRRTGEFVGRTAGRALRARRGVAAPVIGLAGRALGSVGRLVRGAVGRAGQVVGRIAAPAARVIGRAGGFVADTVRRGRDLVAGTLGRLAGSVPSGGIAPIVSTRPLVSAGVGIATRVASGSMVGSIARGAIRTAGTLTGVLRRGLGLFRETVPGVAGDLPHLDADALRKRLISGGSTGSRLDPNTLASMQHHLGRDFSDVRIHRDPLTATAAGALQAQAFTIGSDVFFGANRYDPHTPTGQSLIAHELTHVVQQSGGGAGLRPFSRQGGDTLEQEAQLAAKHVLARVGRPGGITVEDYARTYETEDDSEITSADQRRLDSISLMALQMAERSLARQGFRADMEAPSLDISVEINLGEMSDQQAAMVWAEAIVAKLLEKQAQARTQTPPAAPVRVMRAPEKQETPRPRITLTEEAKSAISRDVDSITANVRSWWRKPTQMVEPLRKWYEEDKRLFGVQATPHLDWLIFLMHQRLFDKGTITTRFTSTLDEVERYLADRPEGAAFKLYKSFSQRWKSYQPAKEMEGALTYVAKRELYAGWMIIKGMGTALTGLADVGIWAFWKTSGWPLRKVLEKFGVKADKLYLTPYIDKKFDETADILQKELGIDANEKLFGGMSLKTFSEAGGKVVGGLMTAGALGQVAKAGQAAQVAGNLDKARKIQLGLQAVNVTQGLQQVEQLGDRIKQLREGPPPQSWSDIVKRPDVWSQVVGIMGTAVGAKMSWSQAQGMVSKTAQRVGLALNATQTGLLAGAYAAVESDPTLTPEEKEKARADILAQIVTTGALMADSVWGAKFEAWKQKRAEARQQQAAAERQKKLEAEAAKKALPKPREPAGTETAAKAEAAEAAEPTQKSKVKPPAKAAEEQAAKTKAEAAASRQAVDDIKQAGDWDALLKRHGAGSKTVKQAQAERARIIKEISQEFGATPTGTAGAASDVDVTFPTERALHAARRKMEQRYGPHWEKLFKASFNSDVMRAHAHLDQRLQLTPEQRAAVEARLSRTSERMILERLKAAGAHSDAAKAAFKEEAARLGIHKSEVEIPRLTKSQVRALELQQDAAVANYEKTLKTLEAARSRGNTPPDQLAALQDKAIRQSIAITERQMRINQAYPDRYMTPGGVKGTVSGEVLSKFDRTAYAQKVMEQLAKQQDPKAPRDPKELWAEAYRRARVEEARTKQWRESFKNLTPQEAYQRTLMERLELVEQMTKAEGAIRKERGPGARVTREEVLQRVFEQYEFSKYAARAMDTANKLGIGGFDDLAAVAKGIYKPPKTVGGTEARGAQVRAEAGRRTYYLDERGRPVLQSRPDIRMTVYAGLLDRAQKQIIARLHEIVQGQMDIPDLPHGQSHGPLSGAGATSGGVTPKQ